MKGEAISLIRKAYESGINYFDIAYVYGGGDSEKVLGEAFSVCSQAIDIPDIMQKLDVKIQESRAQK